MASIRRIDDRFEIRECRTTENGPRQFSLAGFRGVLTPDILDRAERKARRPFDRERLLERAHKLGVPVSHRRRFPEARALLASLQRGARVDPGLVSLLMRALEPLVKAPPPEHLEDAAHWLGQPEWERGHALRDLLRTADRVLASRAPLRSPPRERYPRFASRPLEAGS